MCLDVEIPNPRNYVISHIGKISIIVVRNEKGENKSMVNTCTHRGELLCHKCSGMARKLSCIYHALSYDLNGNLANIAFSKGPKIHGGVLNDFKKMITH